MTVRRRGPAAALALVVAACCALATYVTHRVFVGTTGGQTVDQAVLENATALPGVEGPAASVLSDTVFTTGALVACLLLVVLGVVRRAPWHAVAALVLVVGANVTTQVLKRYVFERPDLLDLGAPNSLPSGHTTVVASIALGLALLAPPAMRVPAAVTGLAGSIVIGVATVVLGWHRMSDVAAALLVSMAWAGLVLAVLVLRPRHRHHPSQRPQPQRCADPA